MREVIIKFIGKRSQTELVGFFIIFLILLIIFITGIHAATSGTSNNANLTIWDDTDLDLIKLSNSNVYFYANYTNATSGVNLTAGNCSIRFQNSTNDFGNWFNMSYNFTNSRFQYNRTFNYKGNYIFEVNCSNGTLFLVNLSDYFNITNSVPQITLRSGGTWIDFDGNTETPDTWQCTEDTACYYNFTSNVTDIDTNDVLSYAYDESNTTLTNYTLDANGYLLINVTNSVNTGSGKKIELKVKDNDENALWQSGLLAVNVIEVNDAPVFDNLANQSFNISELFEYIVNISDEENNTDFSLNISFMNCSTAEWSDRNNTNCTLFTLGQYSFDATDGKLNISFIPIRNDVGSYIINFSVTDNSSLGNKTTSELINFTVFNVNQAPYFRYVCDNERNATEDVEFSCWINASDIDELINLTFSANYSWFTFYNDSDLISSIGVACNSSTSYNASALVNFTPTDIAVGNWSVNITVIDIGSGFGVPKSNSTLIWFYIGNIEDDVSLDMINNYTLYENQTIYVNASDNDLLVPDKNVKNEVLSYASNSSWVNISVYSSPENSNYTTARIDVNYDWAFVNLGAGNYTVKINVTDTGGNYAERNFSIQILGDNAAVWNSSMNDIIVIYENNRTYFNFTQNVTDPDGDSLNFSFTTDTSFSSFNINSTTGVVNFTPIDIDVGSYSVTINASDGKLNSLKTLNFTVYNVNDAPYIERPILQAEVSNASVDANSNINCTEDNITSFQIWIQDDDFRVIQKSFYNESLTINLTIQGPNTALFSFARDLNFPTASGTNANKSHYTATFTPGKSDVGNYNISINVSGIDNLSSVLIFNLTVFSVEHEPVLMNLSNQTSSINRNLYYRINVTDSEDGNSSQNGNANFTFAYTMIYGEDIFNATTFNSTTGEINITFNATNGGKYHLNVSVNDSSGRDDFSDFWINVYDIPNITSPLNSYLFSIVENITSNLTFQTNHSVGDNLTYWFYIENNNTEILRYNQSFYGNASNFTWEFTPNFTDETYNNSVNLTLITYSSLYPDLNVSQIWNISINHSNAPVVFSGSIGDYQSDYNSDIEVNLGNYFSDSDYSDFHYNQTLRFNVSSNVTPSYISWSVSGLTLTLSSLIAVSELLVINASDLENNSSLTNASSNSFQVEFTTPTTTPTPTPSGGGSSPVPVSFKIIAPRYISAYAYERIEIPLELVNKGNKAFSGISILSSAFKDGNIANTVQTSLDKNYFKTLNSKKSENLTLTVFFDTDKIGDYEILVNASSKSPVYTDWAKIHISLQRINESEVEEFLIFTEEYIAQNPECIEITEVVEEAKAFLETGDYINAQLKAEQAVNKCKEAVSQVGLPTFKFKSPFTINEYLVITVVSSLFIGLFYYSLKRWKFRKAMKYGAEVIS